MFDPKKITAADIMTGEVLALESGTLVPRAVAALVAHGVSGAPVVDAAGRCVGVFSLADLARRDAASAGRARPRPSAYFSFDPLAESLDFPGDAYLGLAHDTIDAWMARGVKSVRPEASAEEVCKLMLREEIHRVVVMKGKALRGIVSSLDVVRMVASGGPAAAKRASRPRARVARPRAPGRAGARPRGGGRR
jgi:CBS domain-containing protein